MAPLVLSSAQLRCVNRELIAGRVISWIDGTPRSVRFLDN